MTERAERIRAALATLRRIPRTDRVTISWQGAESVVGVPRVAHEGPSGQAVLESLFNGEEEQ